MQSLMIITNLGQDGGIAANLIKFVKQKTVGFISVYRTGSYNDPLGKFEYMGEHVIVVGDILKPDMIQSLREKYNVTVLDYHERFISEYSATENDILNPTVSLTELAWIYLFPDKEPTEIIKLISDYEMWTFNDDRTLPLHYGLGLESAYDDDFIQKLIVGDETYLNSLINKGMVVHNYVEALDKAVAHDTYRLGNIDGHDVIMSNVRGVNSLFFKYVKDDERFKDIKLFMTYAWIPSIHKFRCSLYSEDPNINAGEIAAKHFGGGRKEVAGFNTFEVHKFLVDLKDKVEDNYEYHCTEADALSSNPMVRTYTQQHERILVNSLRYYINISGMRAVVCNLPYVHTDLWFNARVTNVDIGVTYAMTSSGKYRVVITDFSGQDMGKLANDIGGKLMPNGTVWKYADNADWFDK